MSKIVRGLQPETGVEPPEPTLGIPPSLPEPSSRMVPPSDPAERRQYPRLVKHYRKGAFHLERDMLAQEEDMDVVVGEGETYTLSRTPGDDRNFVVGSLFSRSVIGSRADVASLHLDSFKGRDRALVELSSKGITLPALRPLQDTRRERLPAERLFALRDHFESMQAVRKQTGATHGAALFALDGQPLSFGEDVGRHNALDKAIGCAVLEDAMRHTTIAMLSSRLAHELVLKAVACAIPVLVGFSVATGAAVECAQANGITLIGRLRPESMKVYSHSWRLV